MIIGFSGRLGVGKDFIARNVVQRFIERQFPNEHPINLAFADQLKINTIMKHSIPFEKVFVKKTNETRRLLQMEGTEIGRNTYGKDIWIRYMDNWINIWKLRGFTSFLITDCRFKNEIDWIHSQGGVVIRITAPIRSAKKLASEFGESEETSDSVTKHQSERGLDEVDSMEYDFTFDNDATLYSSDISVYNKLKGFIYEVFNNQIFEDDKKNK